MSTPSAHELARRIKALAPTIRERAKILKLSVGTVHRIENGKIPHTLLQIIAAGVLTLAPDTELAHEMNDDTKGADDDNHR